MIRRSYILAISAAVALPVSLPLLPAHAWGEGGHEIVAYIAYARLSPRVKATADRLLKLPIPPKETTARDTDFVRAALWADAVRGKTGFEESGPWHFIDNPFGITPETPIPPGLVTDDNIVTALKSEIVTLQNPAAPPEARAQALRFIIHFVGDIHQPLHCATRVSPLSPQGDRGGNDYRIRAREDTHSDNLHAFWDAGMDRFPESQGGVPAAAQRAMRANPASDQGWQVGGIKGISRWMGESEWLARHAVYTGVRRGKEPSDTYMREGARIANKRVAWAGYRLAALLNQLLARG